MGSSITTKRSSNVQSVGRALDLLEALEEAAGSLSISALAEQTGLPVGTIHRLAQTLVSRGYLRQLPDRRYCLGSRLVNLGAGANALVGIRARPILRALAAEFGETANLAVLAGASAEYVAQASGSHTMRMFTEIGRRVPLHCTGVGKALLSMLDDRDVLRLLQQEGMPAHTSTTLTTQSAMLAELGTIRTRGYAIDEGEMELGVRCVAVPLRAGSLMAVSVSGPAIRLTLELVESGIRSLLRASRRLTEALDDRR